MKKSPLPIETDLKKLETMGGDIGRRASHWRDSLAGRYPIPFLFLSTFGVVATFYGIEKIIDQTPWLADRPYIMLTAGLLALLASGALMKKLK